MNPRTLPTVTLTERVATDCRLGPDAVHALLAHHRAHVELAPTGRRHRYRLTPKGHVGTLLVPGCRLLIWPKIPVRNLFHLLDPAAPLPVFEDRTAAEPGLEMLDFLASRLARLMTERAAAGLHRAYVERAEQGPFVQGRLDVPAQLRDPHGRKDQIHCRYEEFTLDIPCNQVPKATAELVLQSPLLGDAVRPSLSLALQAFAGVTAVPLSVNLLSQAATDRRTETYRPLLDLCCLLSESLGPAPAAGALACPAFLLDMERVFEDYCVRHLAAAFTSAEMRERGYEASVQPWTCPHESNAGQPDLMMRPDFTLHRHGRPCVVVDAKWKRAPLVRADFYQVLAYCSALGFPHGVLVYPGKRDRSWHYVFPRPGIGVTVQTLRVSGSADSCRKSLRGFLRTVRHA